MTHDAGHWDDRYAAAAAGAHSDGDPDGHSHGDPDGRPDAPAASPGPTPRAADHLAADPDPAVVRALDRLPPGQALDLATGLGRHARWLAARGWEVTAVDFSAVGIARAREQGPDAVTWVVADVRSWVPDGPRAPAYDLILAAFVHLDPADFARIRTWLAPGGHLVVVAHAPGDDSGPRTPAFRYDEPQLRAAAEGLTIEHIADNDGRLTLVARHP